MIQLVESLSRFADSVADVASATGPIPSGVKKLRRAIPLHSNSELTFENARGARVPPRIADAPANGFWQQKADPQFSKLLAAQNSERFLKSELLRTPGMDQFSK